MSRQGPLSLLTWMVAMAVSSMAFNIDEANPKIYKGEEQDFFGYKVLQFISDKEKGVMVSAPYQKNGSGGICRCAQDRTNCTDCYTPQETDTIKYIGLSMAGQSTSPPTFTACSPGLAHECDGNSYLNSICYQFNSQLHITSNFTPAFQECTKKIVDLVFLFDGSGSMTRDEFDKNKGFINNIMTTLTNSSIKFAAVQFSSRARTVFNFNDYQEGRALDNLWKEEHMADLTNTHKAIDFVLKNIFENQAAGATADATKVLVIITDGNPSDTDRNNAINRSDEKNIIRFIIGVKNVNLMKLKSLASEPKENNTFLIMDYNGLKGILDNFQKKIFNIEGSKTALAGNLTKEMSQSGFSAVYVNKDTLVLGSVGSNNWRGSLFETEGLRSEEREIQDPTLDKDSYMGYSVAVGKKNENLLYFTGAPRSEHMGQILLFNKVNNNWTVAQRLSGEQMGSYFGAELCSVDIDSDGNTDFLLVGAPMFHQPPREGRIYVYTLTDKLELRTEMSVSVLAQGRFGSSISSLTDLNGDGLKDVAVGAPLEDDHRGAVYIYLGEKLKGIRPEFSQRISAVMMRSKLQFFGQAIDGKMDLGEDGLTDIVVGARGAVVVLRSRPVLSISAHLHFHPLEISTNNFDCLAEETISPVVTLTACFNMAEATKSKAEVLSAGMNFSYSLNVDPVRQRSRAFYSDTNKGARSILSTVELRKQRTCFNHSVYMTQCVIDTLSPIVIKLNLSQSESQQEGRTAILNTASPTQAVVEVPFEKNCKENETCVAELEVDFNFITSTLLVVDQSYFNVTIRLSNHGDDSYNTSLTLLYPPGLSFSMMHLLKSTRRTVFSCGGLEGEMDRTTCSVSLPVYRSKTTAVFTSKFHILSTYDWNDTMEMSVIGLSDNGNSTNSSLTRTIPVQFAVDLVAKALPQDSTTYINFTLEDTSPKGLVNVYEVQNLGFKSVPVTVTFTFPTKLEHRFEMKDYQISVLQNHTQCGKVINSTTEYCSPEKYCKSIECESFLLKKLLTVTFVLSGNVSFKDLDQRSLSLPKKFTGDREKVNFISFVKLSYDKKRYVQTASDPGDNSTSFHQTQIDVQAEMIIPPHTALIKGTGVGVGLFLLIIITMAMYMLGCFKRKRLVDNAQEDENEGEQREQDDAVQPIKICVTITEIKLEPESEPETGAVDSNPLLDDSQTENNGFPTSEAVGEGPKEKQDVSVRSRLME
ncbi:LOW QUALITY PROTEIN: integrin alpha-L [Salmo salar]|uniref:LOW QUALITY PROTEIN: integrin alpha-L n=1 Tax=Salmo salar TaxID=8030 RepID=A0ABM3CKY2_SALSA|nr:LOW QUALITY PROTEIN: integrin alpha-L [Salmo salar]